MNGRIFWVLGGILLCPFLSATGGALTGLEINISITSTCKVPLVELRGIKDVLDKFLAGGQTDEQAMHATHKIEQFVPKPNQCSDTLNSVRENTKLLIKWQMKLVKDEGTKEEIDRIRKDFAEVRNEVFAKISAMGLAVRQKEKMIQDQIKQNKGDLMTITALQIMAGDTEEAFDTFSELKDPSSLRSVISRVYQPGFIEDIMKFLQEFDDRTDGTKHLINLVKNADNTDDPDVFFIVYYANLFVKDPVKSNRADLNITSIKNELQAGVRNKLDLLARMIITDFIPEVQQYEKVYLGFFDTFLEELIEVTLTEKQTYRDHGEQILKLSEPFTPSMKARTYLKIYNFLRMRNVVDPILFKTGYLLTTLGIKEYTEQMIDKRPSWIANARRFTLEKNSTKILATTGDWIDVYENKKRAVNYTESILAHEAKSQWEMESNEGGFLLKNRLEYQYLVPYDIYPTPKIVVSPREHSTIGKEVQEWQLLVEPLGGGTTTHIDREVFSLLYNTWTNLFLVPGKYGPELLRKDKTDVYDIKNYWIVRPIYKF